jgi:hypothetical protein
MKLNPNFPDEVYSRAHAEYPRAVALKGLYAMAFFGHGRPKDLDHKETCGSVWRGLVRKHLKAYTAELYTINPVATILEGRSLWHRRG